MDSDKISKSEDEKFTEKCKDIFTALTKEHDLHKKQLLNRKTKDEQ